MKEINFLNFPKNPGIYIYKNKKDEIIYIGKAKNLRNRIKQYFQKNIDSIKTEYLVKNIDSIDYIIVNNELEALLLENRLIKKYKPKYNINLKDSKTYPYIKITKDKIPKIITTRKINDNSYYFGPYANIQLRNELLDLCVEIFHLITPKTFLSKSKLNYQIGLSPAESLNKINLESYNKNVLLAIDFLNQKDIKTILDILKKQMNKFIEDELFEMAKKRKNQIDLIKNELYKQQVDIIKDFNQDIIVKINDKNNKTIIGVININKGILSTKQEFNFSNTSKDFFKEFLKMFYTTYPIPKEIIVNEKFWETKKELDLIEQYLSYLKKSKTKIIFPNKGEKKSLVELCEKNFKMKNSRITLEDIRDKLKLNKIPKTIECFDISNLGSEHLVGAMTRWVDGKKDEQNYRKFEIREVKDKNDDFASLREVLTRRYKRIIEKKEVKGEFPNLILIDGGLGHFNIAKEVLIKLKIYNKIDLISIAKGQNRDKNEIYIKDSNKPLIFDNNLKMMLYLIKIRDSVHKFVIGYNRKKRKMKFNEQTKF